jgi:hypothetical protein
MAYSLQQQPGAITTAFNPLTFVVRETDTGITGAANFRYQCLVEVEGTNVANLKAPIRYGSANNEAVFDITEIIASYVGADMTALSGVTRQDRLTRWRGRFGYEKGSPVVETSGVVNTAYNLSWGACVPIQDYPTFVPADYVVSSGGTAGAKFLTGTRGRQVMADEPHSVTALFGDDGVNRVFEFKAYTAAGTLIDTVTKSKTYVDWQDCLLAVDCTFNNIGFTLGSNTPAYYTVSAYPSGFTGKRSEVLRFDLWQECSKYTPVYLHFLNTLGGYDSFPFRRRTIQRLNAEKKTYEQDAFQYSAGSYTYGNSRGGVQTYNTSITEEWELNTDFLSDADAALIEQLQFSPVCYMGDNWQALERVTLPGTEFERKYNRDGLVQYTVRIRRSLVDRRQRL